MKLQNVLLEAMFGFILLSCSSDENPNNNTNNNNSTQDLIVGTWNLKSVENQGNDVPVFGCGNNQTITYNGDNTGEEYFPEEYNQIPCQFNTVNFTWTRSDNQITRESPGEGTSILNVLQLTDDRLQTVVIERDGNEVPIMEREIFKYEK